MQAATLPFASESGATDRLVSLERMSRRQAIGCGPLDCAGKRPPRHVTLLSRSSKVQRLAHGEKAPYLMHFHFVANVIFAHQTKHGIGGGSGSKVRPLFSTQVNRDRARSERQAGE
jgi:hypothetical protein